jgi:hypothetical protein
VERLFQILDLVLAVDQYLHITFHAVDMNTVWMAATTQPKFPVSVIMRVMLQLDVNPDSVRLISKTCDFLYYTMSPLLQLT